jgi:hypothetical protein
VRELLDILDTYTRGSREGTQRRKEAGAKLRALSEENTNVVVMNGNNASNPCTASHTHTHAHAHTHTQHVYIFKYIYTYIYRYVHIFTERKFGRNGGDISRLLLALLVQKYLLYWYKSTSTDAEGMAETSPGCYLLFWYKRTCFTGAKVQVTQ